MLHCFPSLTCTLLSYRDIRQNGFHSETYADKQEKYIFFTICNGMASTFSMYHLDCTTHTTHSRVSCTWQTWHTRLGHRDIGLKPKLSAIPIIYDYYDAKSNNIWILCALHVTQGS